MLGTIKAAVAAIAFALIFAPAVASSEPLALAYPPANDFLPAFVAKDMGFFANRNLDVTLSVQRVSNLGEPAVEGQLRARLERVPRALKATS
jgi:ABC-type nitrate/sulfonate/bicarbonate transport system substrate-binding protein